MKRLMLVCLLILCLLPLGVCAESTAVEWFTGTGEIYNSLGEHFFYEIEDDHAVLTDYSVDSDKPQPARVVVPDVLGGKPLTAVGWGAFNNYDGSYNGEDVECIVLPEGITELRTNAFQCAHYIDRLELPSTLEKIATDYPFYHLSAEISFPNGNPFYTIDNGFLIDTRTNALIYCNPSAQTLPLPRVRRIEDSALSNYRHQQEILEFPDSVDYIGPFNAYDCVNLKKIIVPGSVIELADHALYCSYAEEIILNEGLQKIGSEALTETYVHKLTIPSTVTWIGYYAFDLGYDEYWQDPEESETDNKNHNDSEEDDEDYDDSVEDNYTDEDDDSDDSEEYSLIVLNPDVHWETEKEYAKRKGY